MKNAKLSKKIGFSLVELLVVLALIGGIAVIAIPNIKVISETAKKNQAKRQAKTSNAAELATAQAAGDVAHILMVAWNDAIIKGDTKHEADQGLAQIVTLVSGSPAKFGLTDQQAVLLKGAHPKGFSGLIVDTVTGQLVLVRPVNPAASSVKPGPNGESPDKT